MPYFEFATVFYRLNVDGLDGNASRIGADILKPNTLNWKKSTWAVSDSRQIAFGTNLIIAAKLSRSRTAPLLKLDSSGGEPHLLPNPTETNEFIPIAFFSNQHVFAIPERAHFPTATVLKVLTALAGSVLGKLTFFPLLREQSLRERLKSYKQITELSIRIIRANPESKDDTKLFTDALNESHVQRALLRYRGDPRGLNIDSGIIKQQIDYIEEGQGELQSGKAINSAGLEEPISGKKIAPMSLTIHSTGEPENFAQQLISNNPLNPSNPPRLPSSKDDASG